MQSYHVLQLTRAELYAVCIHLRERSSAVIVIQPLTFSCF